MLLPRSPELWQTSPPMGTACGEATQRALTSTIVARPDNYELFCHIRNDVNSRTYLVPFFGEILRGLGVDIELRVLHSHRWPTKILPLPSLSQE